MHQVEVDQAGEGERLADRVLSGLRHGVESANGVNDVTASAVIWAKRPENKAAGRRALALASVVRVTQRPPQDKVAPVGSPLRPRSRLG